MPQEVPLQYDMFTDELVDTRSCTQKRRGAANDRPKQAEMFSTRELAQFGVRANPQLPLSPKTRLELSIQDPRTEEEKEYDRMKAAEAKTYHLLPDVPATTSDPFLTKSFPSGLRLPLTQVEELDVAVVVQLTAEASLPFWSTRDAAYDHLRDDGHQPGDAVYTVGDDQLEIWKPDRTGYFLVTYSAMEMLENVEWISQAGNQQKGGA
jgi:hypothetical protein